MSGSKTAFLKKSPQPHEPHKQKKKFYREAEEVKRREGFFLKTSSTYSTLRSKIFTSVCFARI
jgi:hypothetical protein